MNKNISEKSLQKGFTLIEMIISLAIFTVVALVAVGALVKVMDANRKSINLKNTINNLNFTLESMSREMRVGSKYFCAGDNKIFNHGDYNKPLTAMDCETGVTGLWTIAFTSSKKKPGLDCNIIYVYRYTGIKLQKAQESSSNACNNAAISEGDFSDLTSSNIKITNSIVTIDNSSRPYAKFFFKGESGTKVKDKVDFAIQTSVTQRIE